MDRTIQHLLRPFWRYELSRIQSGAFLTFRVQKTGLDGVGAYYAVCLSDIGLREWDDATNGVRQDAKGNDIPRHAEAIGSTIDEALINLLAIIALYIEDMPTERTEVPEGLVDAADAESEGDEGGGSSYFDIDGDNESVEYFEKLRDNHMSQFFSEWDAQQVQAMQSDRVQSALWNFLGTVHEEYGLPLDDWTNVYEMASHLVWWRNAWAKKVAEIFADTDSGDGSSPPDDSSPPNG